MHLSILHQYYKVHLPHSSKPLPSLGLTSGSPGQRNGSVYLWLTQDSWEGAWGLVRLNTLWDQYKSEWIINGKQCIHSVWCFTINTQMWAIKQNNIFGMRESIKNTFEWALSLQHWIVEGENVEILNSVRFSFNIPLIMQVLHFPRCTGWHNAG